MGAGTPVGIDEFNVKPESLGLGNRGGSANDPLPVLGGLYSGPSSGGGQS